MPHLPGETPAGGPGDDVGIQPVQQVVVGQRAGVHADCGSSSGAGRKCCRRVSGGRAAHLRPAGARPRAA